MLLCRGAAKGDHALGIALRPASLAVELGGDPGEVFVLLSDKPRPEEMAPDITCAPFSWARYCERSETRENNRNTGLQ